MDDIRLAIQGTVSIWSLIITPFCALLVLFAWSRFHQSGTYYQYLADQTVLGLLIGLTILMGIGKWIVE